MCLSVTTSEKNLTLRFMGFFQPSRLFAAQIRSREELQHGTDGDREEGAQHPWQAACHGELCGAKGKGCKCSFPLVNLPPNWMMLRLKTGDAGWCFFQIIMSSVCSWSAALTQRSSWLPAPAVGSQPVLHRPPGTQKNHCSWMAFCYRQQEGVRPCEQNPFF